MLELEKMTLATVDSAFDQYEIDSLALLYGFNLNRLKPFGGLQYYLNVA